MKERKFEHGLSLFILGISSVCMGVEYSGKNQGYRTIPHSSIPENVTSIDLSNNAFTNITRLPGFNSYPSLNKLDLQVNQIVDISCDTLVDTSLSELRLSENSLKAFPDLSCIGKKLNDVYLDQNEIDTVDIEIFYNLDAIHVLDLEFNKITDVTFFKALQHESTIRTILLQGNPLVAIDGSFQDLSQLLVLKMGKMQLKALTPDEFTGTKIQSLALDRNSISQFPDLTSIGSTLTSLQIPMNQLQSITALDLKNLDVLEYLFISSNPRLGQCPDITFICDTLQVLHLAGIGMKVLEAETFTGCTKLKKLHINHNDIESLSSILMLKTSLEYLAAHNNKITTVDERILTSMERLSELILRNNPIMTIYEFQPAFTPLSLNIQSITMMHCDCQWLWLWELQQGADTGVTVVKSAAPCQSPPELVGIPWSDISCHMLCYNHTNRCPGTGSTNPTTHSTGITTDSTSIARQSTDATAELTGLATKSANATADSTGLAIQSADIAVYPNTLWQDGSTLYSTPTTGIILSNTEQETSSQAVSELPLNVWLPWTKCTAQCGGGLRTRLMICDNNPQCKRQLVSGQGRNITYDVGNESCNTSPCPVDGIWLPWEPWASCSTTCGMGTKRSLRKCYGPFYGGVGCDGQSQQTSFCNLTQCTTETVRDQTKNTEVVMFTVSDHRAPAKFLGGIAIVFMVTWLVLIVMIDGPTILRHCTYLKQNVLDVFSQIRN